MTYKRTFRFKINLYCALALFLLACANKNTIDTAGDLTKKAESKKIIDSLMRRCDYYQDKNGDSALFYANAILPIAKTTRDTNNLISALYIKAHIYSNAANFPKAMESAFQALAVAQYGNNSERKLPVFYTIGEMYVNRDLPDSAVFYFLKAYQLIDSTTAPIVVATLSNSIGTMMGIQGNNRPAVKYLWESVEIVRRLKDTAKVLYALSSLLTYAPVENHLDSIKHRYYRHLFINELLQAPKIYTNSVVYATAAYCFETEHQYANAILFYKRAIEESSKDGKVTGNSSYFYKIAGIYARLNEFDSAAYYLNINTAGQVEKNSLENQRLYYDLSCKVYEHKGDFRKALQMYKKKEYIDSISLARERDRRLLLHEQTVTRLRSDKELAKKEKRIAQQRNNIILLLLITSSIILIVTFIIYALNQKGKRLRKEKELAAIASQQKENELYNSLLQQEMATLFAQLNPHFVFNSLNPLVNFIFDNKNKEALNYLNHLSTLMRGFIDLSQIQFTTIAAQIIFLENYAAVQKHRFDFSFVVTIDPQIQQNDVLVPALMLQPIIENAIEHGITHIKENRLIRLTMALQRNDEAQEVLSVTISNNGPLLKKGFDPERGHALSIIHEQLNKIAGKYKTGAIYLRNKNNPDGVECLIYLPVITIETLKNPI